VHMLRAICSMTLSLDSLENKNKEFYFLAGAKNGRGGNKTPHCTIARLPCMKLAKAGVQDDKAALC